MVLVSESSPIPKQDCVIVIFLAAKCIFFSSLSLDNTVTQATVGDYLQLSFLPRASRLSLPGVQLHCSASRSAQPGLAAPFAPTASLFPLWQ